MLRVEFEYFAVGVSKGWEESDHFKSQQQSSIQYNKEKYTNIQDNKSNRYFFNELCSV